MLVFCLLALWFDRKFGRSEKHQVSAAERTAPLHFPDHHNFGLSRGKDRKALSLGTPGILLRGIVRRRVDTGR